MAGRRRDSAILAKERWGSRPYRADQALGERNRSAPRTSLSEGDDGHGGECLMGQSQYNVAIGRASGNAGTSARAWSPFGAVNLLSEYTGELN